MKDQNMKKYKHYIDARGEVLPTAHRNNDKVLGWINFVSYYNVTCVCEKIKEVT